MTRLVNAIGRLLYRLDWELSWDFYEALRRAGFWRIEDGDHWRNGGWRWAWWRERCDRLILYGARHRRDIPVPSLVQTIYDQRRKTWWDRLGWRLERMVPR